MSCFTNLSVNPLGLLNALNYITLLPVVVFIYFVFLSVVCLLCCVLFAFVFSCLCDFCFACVALLGAWFDGLAVPRPITINFKLRCSKKHLKTIYIVVGWLLQVSTPHSSVNFLFFISAQVTSWKTQRNLWKKGENVFLGLWNVNTYGSLQLKARCVTFVLLSGFYIIGVVIARII